ncbi:hypothetical protein ACTI_75550 [Actinoplanes sp. OR16]|uniref:hypothetical protein n=1 Tax=Actinoplanes sp. OR16 TaxID=946334 RepID=UPI000F70CB85|nr:hypothetical protein [Actinoplanes sp. OR16]BBH70870.1 hypothetical protein ACTI_75550 [Actinoplanes sp. OR16]
MIQNVAGTFVGQDFGTWSRADIERVAAAVPAGGPVQVHSTEIHHGQERFGFGAFTAVELVETCAPDELAAVHAATLAAVVAVLGPPPMVGGPGAWAFWRDPRVRVERDLRRSSVTVRVEPAEPAENEEYINSQYLEGWEPPHLWTAEPDMNSDAGKALIGMMLVEARPATTWDEFETSLRALLVSLASDLPALSEYVTHLGWEIQEVDGDHMVASWMNEGGVNIHSVVYNTTDETTYPKMPLEPESGARAAEIAIDTIRSWGRDSPEQLRFDCWTAGSDAVRLSLSSGIRLA